MFDQLEMPDCVPVAVSAVDAGSPPKKPRQCANVFSESATAVAEILTLHFPTGTILDVNFGLGAFYRKTARAVTGVDIRPPAEIICDNRKLPFADDSFDVGVCDPPYKRGEDASAAAFQCPLYDVALERKQNRIRFFRLNTERLTGDSFAGDELVVVHDVEKCSEIEMNTPGKPRSVV